MGTKLNANAQAVLDVVRATDNHPTAADVYEKVKAIRPKMGLASVYRILRMLVEEGYIKEIRYLDETCHYDGYTARHDHAICTHCGTLLDIPIDVQISMQNLLQAAQETNFTLSTHEVRLYGLCSTCSAAS